MRIGIVGAGKIGGTLTRRLRGLGYDVTVANARDPASLASLVQETGATATRIGDVAKDRDIVVVAVPMKSIADLDPAILAAVPLVIDTSNYYPRERDGRIADIEDGLPESRWVEQHLRRPVIKTFNAMIADHIRDKGLPAGTPGRIALAVAGDDTHALAVAMKLVDTLGFDPIDAGDIADSWQLQPGTPVYLRDLSAEGVRAALADASRDRPAKFRATSRSPGTYDAPA